MCSAMFVLGTTIISQSPATCLHHNTLPNRVLPQSDGYEHE